jgi:hypothetical protein
MCQGHQLHVYGLRVWALAAHCSLFHNATTPGNCLGVGADFLGQTLRYFRRQISLTLRLRLSCSSASSSPRAADLCASPHSFGAPRRPTFPLLNLHRVRVHRKSRAAPFKSMYRKRARASRFHPHSSVEARFRYITGTFLASVGGCLPG